VEDFAGAGQPVCQAPFHHARSHREYLSAFGPQISQSSRRWKVSASDRHSPQSCRTAPVKSFGRRRRTKVFEERTRGPETGAMGI